MQNKNNKQNKIGVYILVILIIWCVYFLIHHIDKFKQLSLIHPEHLITIILFAVIHYGIIGLITKYLSQPLDLNLGIREAFGLSTVSGLYNFLFPFKAGAAIRALYLKKKYNFKYADFISALSVNYILIFWIGSLLGLLSMLWIYHFEQLFNFYIFVFFVMTSVTLSFIVFHAHTFPETRHSWFNKVIRVINNLTIIKNNQKVLLFTALLSCAQLLNAAIMLYLQFHVFGFEITFVKSILLAVIGSIGVLIGITPANLGIKEAFVVLSATTIGITPVESLSVVLLGRAITIFVLVIFGSFFSYHFGKEIGHTPS